MDSENDTSVTKDIWSIIGLLVYEYIPAYETYYYFPKNRTYFGSNNLETFLDIGDNLYFRLKLKHKIGNFIIKFYMLDTSINHLKEDPEYIKKIQGIFENEFELTYNRKGEQYLESKEYKYKKECKDIILKYTKEVAQDFINLIKDSPEKIDINEKRVAGINKNVFDVLNFEEDAKLHKVLKDQEDSVIFMQPVEYMRSGTLKPVDYKYLSLTHPKHYIKDWLKEKKRILYCETDPSNIFKDIEHYHLTTDPKNFFKNLTKYYENYKQIPYKTPYILCPLIIGSTSVYVKLWDMLHIIYSKQRIFYVLPSHYHHLGAQEQKCMNDKHSEKIIKLGICLYGPNCWSWNLKGQITATKDEMNDVEEIYKQLEEEELANRRKIQHELAIRKEERESENELENRKKRRI